MRFTAIIAATLLTVACDITINSGGNSGTGTGGSGPFNPTAPTPPTPTPIPGPTNPNPGTGFRTPDPAPGTVLPIPSYTQQTILAVTTPLGNPCVEFTYLDAVVDALRLHDTRWGYVCGSDCLNARRDKIAYHAVAGAEVTGVTGVWIFDIIGNACEAGQFKAYQILGFDANVGWTSRGRF